MVDELNPGAGADVFSRNSKTKAAVFVRMSRARPWLVCHPLPNDGVACCIDGRNFEGFTGGAKHPTREAATFESHCSSDSGFARSRAAFDVVANIHAVLRLIYAGSGGPNCLKITRAGISFWLKSRFPAGATLRICVGRGEDISFSPATIFASLASTPFALHPAISLPQGRGCLDLLGFRSDQLLNLFSMGTQLAVAATSPLSDVQGERSAFW